MKVAVGDIFYLRKSFKVFQFCHLYALLLVEQLLACLCDCVVVGFHLAWEILLEPVVLLDEIVDEFYGQLPLDFDCRLPLLGVVEPCLGEPSHSEAVGVDAYCPWNVK